jgi:hypothetical protein
MLITWDLVAVRAMTRASAELGEETARTVLDAPENHWAGLSIVGAWMRKSKQQRNRLPAWPYRDTGRLLRRGRDSSFI